MAVLSKTREQLIEECQGLVRALATKIHRGLPAHLELDDLISYGQVGLAEAARDFDFGRGQEFSTFAYYRIRGAIYDGLSKMSWVKRSQYNRIKYEQMANDVLRLASQEENRGTSSVQDDLRWLKNVTNALAVVYLSTKRAGEDDSDVLEIEDDSCPAPPAAAMAQETNGRLHQLIDQLPAECASLIRATYFEGLTLTEAGQRLGIGKAWASRLHAKALERLGRGLRLAGLND